jgi:DNA-nicking Smr family endonuclease
MKERGPGGDETDPGTCDPVEVPIDGTLDLHTFRPEELGSLLPEWLEACRARGILQVRIVHGKGTGALRRSVTTLLARSPIVLSFEAADEGGGGWGATTATLRP